MWVKNIDEVKDVTVTTLTEQVRPGLHKSTVTWGILVENEYKVEVYIVAKGVWEAAAIAEELLPDFVPDQT